MEERDRGAESGESMGSLGEERRGWWRQGRVKKSELSGQAREERIKEGMV